jgi:titin
MLAPVNATSLPTTPIGVRAAVVSARVDLSWVQAISATSYSIQRATTSAGTYTAIGQATTESFTDATAAAGTQYFYRVSAVNANGSSAVSATVNATIPAVAPTAPASLTATVAAATPTTVRLGWTDRSTNETGFAIERSTNNRTWTSAGTAAANATTFNVTGLARATRYYFRIRALGNGGLNSAYTATVQIRTL